MADILNLISVYDENKFSNDILIPLFRKMGFLVEFNGGQNEKGRDIIATKDDVFGNRDEVIYMQVKKLPLKAPPKEDSRQIQDIIYQLEQAKDTPLVKYRNNKNRRPTRVHLILQDNPKDRVFETIQGFIHKRIHDVEIFTSSDVLGWIDRYSPELRRIIYQNGSGLIGEDYIPPAVTDLSKAVGNTTPFDHDVVYRDLNFITSYGANRNLIGCKIRKGSKVYLSSSSVKLLFPVLCDLELNYDLDIFPRAKKSEFREYIEWLNSIDDVELNNFVIQAQELGAQLSSVLADIEEREKKLRVQLKVNIDDMEGGIGVDFVAHCLHAGMNWSETITKYDSISSPMNKREIEIIQQLAYEFERKRRGIEAIEEQIEGVRFDTYSLDEHCFNEYFEKLTKSYDDALALLGKGLPKEVNYAQISAIEEIEKLFLKYKNDVSNLYRLANGSKTPFDYNDCISRRLNCRPHAILDSGHNIGVFGSAGAGKTTTLIDYFNYRNRESGKVLFVPLNRSLKKLIDYKESLRTNFDILETLDVCLKKGEHNITLNDVVREEFSRDIIEKYICASRNVDISIDNVNKVREEISSGYTVILDGLDEVANAVDGILDSIRDFRNKYSDSSIIVSSRDNTKKILDLGLFGITLEPFNETQLVGFIESYLDDELLVRKMKKMLESSGIGKILRTPLLATLACDLTKIGVNLFNSEEDLYRERFILLTDRYDREKNVDRQVNSSERIMIVLTSLAYNLQKNARREFFLDEAIDIVCEDHRVKFDRDLIDSCIKESVDPCNVIILDNVADVYSFGHLRYQEYLAKEYIAKYRDVDLSSHLVDERWNGVMSLVFQSYSIPQFSKAVEDFISENGCYTSNFKEIANQIAPFRTSEENFKISNILELHRKIYRHDLDYGVI